MKNWKCKLGLHDYKYLLTQKLPHGVVGFLSMCPLERRVEKCNRCPKIRFIGLDIAANVHNDNTLNWQPKI